MEYLFHALTYILKGGFRALQTTQTILIFFAERLSENAKTISLSTQEQKILKFVTNKSQEVLKSFAEKPQISDLHVLGFRSFEIFLSNHAFLDF